jgi:hypothetical protein
MERLTAMIAAEELPARAVTERVNSLRMLASPAFAENLYGISLAGARGKMELQSLCPVLIPKTSSQINGAYMAIQQSGSRVDRTESFPANQDSTFPSKGTVKGIIYSTILIAVFGILLGMANHRTPPLNDSPGSSQIREQAPKAGAHDQQ